MTERERLIEMVKDILGKYNLPENIADELLEYGVIVPPCKVGDDLYWINDETNKVEKQEKGIAGITLCPNGKWEVIDLDGNSDLIGTQYAYLSREEAEKALKEREGK